MELKNSISIGADYLQTKVKQQYSNHRTAIVREFLQNCIDSGAQNIFFQFNQAERTLIVMDDGCGMDDHIMINYLFRLGGSLKETIAKSTGGFGAAKLILLFQHEYFEITSYRNGNRYDVHGCADKYSDFTITPSSGTGTIIKIKFLPTYAMDGKNDYFDSFEYDAKNYIQSCEFSCNVTWNDQKMIPYTKGTSFKKLDWAEFYHQTVKEGCSSCNYVKIRINGLTMFEIYVADMKTEVTVELSKSSLDILTENRDGIKYSFQKELYAIIGEFNVDKESFARLQGKTITYHGQNGTTFSDHCIKTLNRFKSILVDRLQIKISQCAERGLFGERDRLSAIYQNIRNNFSEEIRENVMDIFETVSAYETRQEKTKEGMSRLIEAMVVKAKTMGVEEIEPEAEKLKVDVLNSMTNNDFVVKVTKKIDKLPKNLDPNKGISPMYYKLAQVWCHSVKTIAFLCDQKINFKIGWIIDEKAEAMYLRSESGDITFLINPEMKKWWSSESKVNNLKKIARVAAHEFVHHLGLTYHDESFCLKFEDLMEKLDLITNWKDFEKDAYGSGI